MNPRSPAGRRLGRVLLPLTLASTSISYSLQHAVEGWPSSGPCSVPVSSFHFLTPLAPCRFPRLPRGHKSFLQQTFGDCQVVLLSELNKSQSVSKYDSGVTICPGCSLKLKSHCRVRLSSNNSLRVGLHMIGPENFYKDVVSLITTAEHIKKNALFIVLLTNNIQIIT